MRRKFAFIAAIALTPTLAFAQAAEKAPAKPPEKPDTAVGEVVVTATPTQGDRVEVDRRSYDVGKTIQAQTGTLADLLRTVPSVGVDTEGNVSLRGDSDVTITVDGKPSAMFSPGARASAVRSLPASQFERVEVIANPSAADSPEGSGGIINLVSKSARKPGATGSVRAEAGQYGEYEGGFNASYNAPKFTLSTDLIYTEGYRQATLSDERRRQTVAPGVERTTRQLQDYDGDAKVLTARLEGDYDLDARLRLGGAFSAFSLDVLQSADDRVVGQDGRGGAIDIDRTIERQGFELNVREVSGRFRRKIGDDRELTGNLRRQRIAARSDRFEQTEFTSPAAPSQFVSFLKTQTTNTTGLKIDYRNPGPNSEDLKLGYDGRIDDSTNLTLFGSGPTRTAIGIDPLRTGVFDYRLELNAIYGTWQHKWGEDWTVLAGLRLENAKTEVTAPGIAFSSERFTAYPSLHLTRPLGEGKTFSASYSRRVERPAIGDLNPLTTYGDPQTIFRGNAALKPQATDAFELSFDGRKGQTSLSATLFYRQLHNSITQVAQDQGGGVLLLTKANLGDTRRAGVSLSVTRKLTPKLSLTVNSDNYWSEIDAGNLGFTQQRSAYLTSGRASLSWTPTDKDFFQVDGQLYGKTLTPQGYRTATVFVNLGYRRKLTSDLFANFTLQNVLDTNRTTTVFRSPGLDYKRRLSGLGPMAIVTLTYNFGTAKTPREPGFKFGNAPAE